MIYIVRHGETDWNAIKRIMGRTDIELNENGINQAKELKNKFDGIKFDKVFSSPLKRAYQTAKIITDEDVIIDDRITERCNGILEGKIESEIDIKVDFNDKNEHRYGIENIVDFRKRIDSFLSEITQKYKNQNVLIVTHAGVSIYVRCFFEGEPDDGNYVSYKTKNCEVLKYNN